MENSKILYAKRKDFGLGSNPVTKFLPAKEGDTQSKTGVEKYKKQRRYLDELTLDESQTDYTKYDGIFVHKLTVKRSLSTGKNMTIFLPFEITPDEIKECFGQNVTYGNWDRFTITLNPEKDCGYDFSLTHSVYHQGEPVPANTALVVKLSDAAVSEFTVYNKILNVKDNLFDIGEYPYEDKGYKGYWVGSNEKITVPLSDDKVDRYIVNNNQWWRVNSKVTLKGYRTYLEIHRPEENNQEENNQEENE